MNTIRIHTLSFHLLKKEIAQCVIEVLGTEEEKDQPLVTLAGLLFPKMMQEEEEEKPIQVRISHYPILQLIQYVIIL